MLRYKIHPGGGVVAQGYRNTQWLCLLSQVLRSRAHMGLHIELILHDGDGIICISFKKSLANSAFKKVLKAYSWSPMHIHSGSSIFVERMCVTCEIHTQQWVFIHNCFECNQTSTIRPTDLKRISMNLMLSCWHLHTLVASHGQEILSVVEMIISLTWFSILTLMLEVSSSTSSNTICSELPISSGRIHSKPLSLCPLYIPLTFNNFRHAGPNSKCQNLTYFAQKPLWAPELTLLRLGEDLKYQGVNGPWKHHSPMTFKNGCIDTSLESVRTSIVKWESLIICHVNE